MSHISRPPIKYTLPPNISQDQVDNHTNFQKWLSGLYKTLDLQSDPSHPFHRKPFQLYGIEVQGGNYWKGKLSFLMISFDVHNKHGQPDSEKLPGALSLRGSSVAMLIVLQPQELEFADEEYVILTVQPRIAAGSLGFVEIPAGMIDETDASLASTAAREIKEECDLDFSEDELINLTELTFEVGGLTRSDEAHLAKGVFPSPGGCDECIPIFLARKKLSKAAIEEFRGRATGVREENENITLKVVRLKDLWKEGVRDSKALSAFALYEGLKQEGRI